VARLHDPSINFELKELTEWYGLDLSRIAVDECLTPSQAKTVCQDALVELFRLEVVSGRG
jgi:hypothetical protein